MTTLPPPSPVKLGLVIDLDICVGCHACVTSCKEWNTSGYGASLSDQEPWGREASGTFLNRVHGYEVIPDGAEAPPTLRPSAAGDTAAVARRSRLGAEADAFRLADLAEPMPFGAAPADRPLMSAMAASGALGEARVVHFPRSCLHCEDAPCVTVCPTGASYKRAADGIVLVNEDHCMGCGLCAWACPYGARELDRAEGVMKKCTLCVDRIYNETIPEPDRQPACVRACPTGARAFGDLGDPESAVSRLVAARGGMDLMPEQETRPVNKYLPPRPRRPLEAEAPADDDAPAPGGLLGWLDAALARIG